MSKKFMKTLVVAFVLSTLFCTAAFAGWTRDDNNKWIYLLDDEDPSSRVTNSWITDEDGTSYYVDGTGVMATDSWVPGGDSWYYVDSNGNKLYATILSLDNDTNIYLLGNDGAMVSNTWYLDPESDKWYYFGPDGKAYRDGWYNIEGDDYYFFKSGRLFTNGLVGNIAVDENGRRKK